MTAPLYFGFLPGRILAGEFYIQRLGGFLLAYVVRDRYGGSQVLSPGSVERTLFGLNLGVVGGAIVVATAIAALALDARRHP